MQAQRGFLGRIEFLSVRTGRSPPTALHPASWRRSCIRLQAAERMPGEDFHLSDHTRSQAHMPRPCAVASARVELALLAANVTS